MALTVTIPKKMVEDNLSGCKEGDEVAMTGKITSIKGEAEIEITGVSSPNTEQEESEESESPKLSSAARAVLSREES